MTISVCNLNNHIPSHKPDRIRIPRDSFDDVRRLVHLRNEFGCDRLPREKDVQRGFAYENFVSQCLIRAARSLPVLTNVETAESNVLRSVRLGQILFLYTLCPAMSNSEIYTQSAVGALRTCLERSYNVYGGKDTWPPEVLCWLLFNGAITNQLKPLQGWYFRQVAEFLNSHHIRSFDKVEKLMREVCWLEDEFGTTCRAVFGHVLRRGAPVCNE